MIAITVDTDWAPLELILDTVGLIRSYGCKLTVFCTNALDVEADEIALHPCFARLDDLNTPIRTLKECFPQARGIRSHALFFTEYLRPLYAKFGIAYDSNVIQYLRPGIECSIIAKQTISIPLYFMDRFHLEIAGEGDHRFSIDQFHWEKDGLKVFDFHPIHVFLNTNSVEFYERAKQYYHEPAKLKDLVNPGQGIRTLLTEVLTFIRNYNLPTYTMSEIEAIYRPKLLG